MLDWAQHPKNWAVILGVLCLHVLATILMSLSPIKLLKQPDAVKPIQVQFVKPEPKVVTKPNPEPVKKTVVQPKPKPQKKPIKKPKPVVKPKPKPKPKPKKVVKPKPQKKPKPVVNPTIAAKAKANEKARLLEKQQQEQARKEKKRKADEAKKQAEQKRKQEERERQQREREDAERKRRKEAAAKKAAEQQAKQQAAAKAAGKVVDASYRNRVAPTYPRKEQQRGRSGSVTFTFTIGTNGKAKNISVINSTSSSFTKAARKALKASSFNVTKVNGVAVEQKARTTMKFTL